MKLSFERDGPFAFPITPMTATLEVDLPEFERHLVWMMDHSAPALFVACGTGEFASLSAGEVGELARVAVDVSEGKAPVFVGAGQALPVAIENARAAERAGASGLLLFPPYLREFEAEGLIAYAEAVSRSTSLPVILYQRDGIAYEPAVLDRLVRLPNVLGLKDGLGDVERMQRTVAAFGERLTYFNGMPTAETFQPSYRAAGVPFYSSAVFNFVPEVSWAFWRALEAGDDVTVRRIIADFFVPLAELRRQAKGYAVALVKAGVWSRRSAGGPVRAPLVEVLPEHLSALERLIASGLKAAAPSEGAAASSRSPSEPKLA